MLAEGYTGFQNNADGSEAREGLQREGAVLTAHATPTYTEATRRGYVYTASTAVAGVAPGTALSTTPPLALWNPPNSGKVLVVYYASLGYVSGTLGAGTIVLAGVTQTTTPATGTALVPVRNDFSAATGVGKAYQGSTLSGTPTIIRPAFILGASLASTAALPVAITDKIDGSLCVTEGNVLALQGVAAAGSTPLVLLALCWGEMAK